jgi:SP family sugar:H+ symporter-like MFS transporter
MKKNGLMTVRFDHLDHSSEKNAPRDGVQNGAQSNPVFWDYSPLPRVTMRSFAMGILVSMGGLM